VVLTSGSEEEIEIRASAVCVVEEMKELLKGKGKEVKSVEVDWFLWEEGERNCRKIGKHHRVATIYY
jgi:hypothetical protein